jgi:hypothetical protein
MHGQTRVRIQVYSGEVKIKQRIQFEPIIDVNSRRWVDRKAEGKVASSTAATIVDCTE